MKLHGNARTCPNSRRLLIEKVIDQGWSVSAAAAAAGFQSELSIAGWGAFARKAVMGCWIAPRGRCTHPGSCRRQRSGRSARYASCG